MKFSEHWLRTLVDPPIDSEELAERLTMAGLDVEQREIAAPPFSGVVVGRILAVDSHPNADRLTVCKVEVGDGPPLSIVCGAPNAATGMLVPCAMIGAVLPGGVIIRNAAMRFGVALDLFRRAPRVLRVDADDDLPQPEDLAGMDLDVRRL